MKRILATLCAAILLFGCLTVTACDSGKDGSKEPQGETTSTESQSDTTDTPAETTSAASQQTAPSESQEANPSESTDEPHDLPSVGELADLAITVLSCFGNTPDVFALIPEGMAPENHVYEGELPTPETELSVSASLERGIGKQMNLLYDTVLYADSALTVLDKVLSSTSAIAGLYQAFINDHPENFAHYEGTWEEFGIVIDLTDTQYILLANGGEVTVELYFDIEAQTVSGRVAIGNGVALRYTAEEGHLTMAVRVSDELTTMLDFHEDDHGTVNGTMMCSAGLGEARLTTSAMLRADEDYTVCVGTHGDFVVPGQGYSVEVYDSQSGRYVGSEVYETVTLVDYDTVWYPLNRMEGIQTIVSLNEQNGLNAHTVFINGADTPFTVERGLFGKGSRYFDIEYKTMWYYVPDAESGKLKKVSADVPMLFVQRTNMEDYLSEMYELNKNNGLASFPTNTTSAADEEAITEAYTSMMEAYTEICGELTHEAALTFIGERNTWFDKTA